MRLGVHVSIAGKIYESIDRASVLGCETMQIFSRNPRAWDVNKLDTADVDEFKKRRKASGISPLIIHIPYLINLASPEPRLYQKSIKAYIEDIKRANLLGAEYFVMHVGSHLGKGEDFGIKKLSDTLNIIIAKSKPLFLILLENTAGSGFWLGYKFQQIKGIIDGVKEKKKLGLCFDTAHAYSAGYDIGTKEGIQDTINEIDDLIGLDMLKVIHINDSKVPLGSRIDRHEHIGKGKIGLKGFKFLLHHPKLRDLPFILETPKKSPKDDPMNLYTVRKIYNKVGSRD